VHSAEQTRGSDMDATKSNETESILRDWRNKILNGFLAIAAVAFLPALVLVILDSFSTPGHLSQLALNTVLELLLVALALGRRLDPRIRAWGILLVGYLAAISALTFGGLGGSGRDYLVVLPIVALVLAGLPSGIVMAALSALTLVVFGVLVDRGMLGAWLVDRANSTQLRVWLTESTYTLVLLAVAMVLLALYHRFQLQLIDRERRARAELARSQALLERQNTTLEQRVEERTAELKQAEVAMREAKEAAEAANQAKSAFLQQRRRLAGHHQRHPRFLQDRGRQDGPGSAALRPAGMRGISAGPDEGDGLRKGPRAGVRDCPRRPACHPR